MKYPAKKERSKVVTGIKRKQYTKEKKEEMIQDLLSGQTASLRSALHSVYFISGNMSKKEKE